MKLYKILVILGLFVLAIFLSPLISPPKKDQNNTSLSLALYNASKIEDYDPSRISYSDERFFLEMLYSTLVEVNTKGELTAGVASSFFWDKDNLVFQFNRDFKTPDGNYVTALDAFFSIKRQFILGEGNDLQEILCNESIIRSLEDACEGLTVKNESLILKTREYGKYVINMLTDIKYAILPRVAVDKSTLQIKNYTETSGPYYYGLKTNAIKLFANKSHWHYKPSNASTISIESETWTGKKSILLTKFKKGEIDYIPIPFLIDYKDAKKITRENPKVKFHQTRGIHLEYLSFTPFGYLLPVNIRRAIVKAIKTGVNKNRNFLLESQEPVSFFEETPTQGGLKEKDKQKYIQTLNEVDLDILKSYKISISASPRYAKRIKKLIGSYVPQIDFVFNQNLKELYKPGSVISSQPMMVYRATNLSGYENVAKLGFIIQNDIDGYFEREMKTWYKEFMKSDEFDLKENKLSQLQLDNIILDPILIPISINPYMALSQNGWEMDFSRHWTKSPIWKVTKQPSN